MMYTATMNDLGFGPSTSVLRRNNSFEDETESLYYSDLVDAPRVYERGTHSFFLENSGVAKVDVDDCEAMTTVNPSSITGQSLKIKLDPDFDLDAFMAAELSNPPAVEETQELIREMEDFLSQYEDRGGSVPDLDDLAEQLLSMEQQQTLNSMDTSCPVTNGDLSSEDIASAEKMVDELLGMKKGETSNILEAAIKSENLQDSGFVEEPVEEPSFNVSNVTQFSTDEGNVIIVIARPSENTVEDSDSDWTPEESAPRRKPGRKPSARHPLMLDGCKVTKKSYKTIKDKKERKKLQNVEAARRYRDKKKQEALEVENEEQTLLKKNRELKEQLKDVENEMKTMKKLMVELGLLKVFKR